MTPRGTLALNYEHCRMPLDFSLGLMDVKPELKPGAADGPFVSSRVQVVALRHGLKQERVISRNQPLTHGNSTIYQSSYEDAGHGRESATFRVAYDPGRAWKHCGILLICLGLAAMACTHMYSINRAGQTPLRGPSTSGCPVLPHGCSDEERRRAA
jgi:hypothetical protein